MPEMWVYGGNSLRTRRRLKGTVGWWMDYWLFLHAEDTHPIWNARPFGLRATVEALRQCQTRSDRTLRRYLALELTEAARLADFVRDIPSVPKDPILAPNGTISNAWATWADATMAQVPHHAIVESLATAICDALAGNRLGEAAYLTRRLAGEAAGLGRSRRDLASAVKDALCASADTDQPVTVEILVPTLCKLLATGKASYYTVNLSVTPLLVTRAVLNSVGQGQRLVVEHTDEGLRLVGIRNVVYASSPEHAVAKTNRVALRVLETLRLSFYLRTHLVGAAKVMSDGAEDVRWISLPEPFWRSGPNRRAVPLLPPGGFAEAVKSLSVDESPRWHAARWHLSQAFSEWGEDVHAAAAKIWQALEAFAAPSADGALERVQTLGVQYIDTVVPTIVAHVGSKVLYQDYSIRKLDGNDGDVPRGYGWRRGMSAVTWLEQILDRRSHHHWSTWPDTDLFRILGDSQTGLLYILSRRLRDRSSENWMNARLDRDLGLLYGLRNKIVHAGERIFPAAVASYLGRTGAELIFQIMNTLAESLKIKEVEMLRATRAG